MLTARDDVHPLQLALDLGPHQGGDRGTIGLTGLDELSGQGLDVLADPRRQRLVAGLLGRGRAVRPQQCLGRGDGLPARQFGEATGGMEIGAYRVDDHVSRAP
ncbi:hypothetical protein BJF83_08260 [Nocardiopsis sp. CNR-923]|nr:hypothetical protein BJF83_08260 [Nocardiopsis sp. CNR-923]